MQDLSQSAATDLPLTFPKVLVIVGGGSLDLDLLAQLAASGAALVGADGGGDVIAAAGLKPNAIIGDFDSLADPLGWLGRTRLVRISEQETTDFEKALYSTRAPVTVALGMTGKRFDHTLAALDAVTRYARQRSIILVDESDIALAVSGPFSFTAKAGERVSVHPLQPVLFRSSDGLKYSLEGLRLAPGERTGTSNEADKRTFAIEPAQGEDGVWLLILEKSNLAGLIEAVMKRRG